MKCEYARFAHLKCEGNLNITIAIVKDKYAHSLQLFA
jgi:hypothetical protein